MKKLVSILTLLTFTVYINHANDYGIDLILDTFYADSDNDGFGDPSNSITGTWPPPPGYVFNRLDCNDANFYIRPNAAEVCNNIDDNCNGLIDLDDPLIQGAHWYADADGDGYRDLATLVIACVSPPGYLTPFAGIDCDDTNPAIHPGVPELCNEIDDNCDGLIDPEICNGWDDDCDGLIDEDEEELVAVMCFCRAKV